jgi:hypothetical protein
MENEIFKPIENSKRVSCFTGIPSLSENDKPDSMDFQGVERLTNTLSGKTYQLIIISEPVSKIEIEGMRKRIYQIYDNLYRDSKLTETRGSNISVGESKASGTSQTRTTNKGINITKSTGNNYTPSGGGHGNSTTDSKGTSKSRSDAEGNSETITQNAGMGQDYSTSREQINKEVQEVLNYIDEELLDRIKLGYNKGFFKTSSYLLTEDKATLEMLENSSISLFNGNKSSFNPL